MKLHAGKTDNPGSITFLHRGYWFQGVDDVRPAYRLYSGDRRPITHQIDRMWGVSGFGVFIGVMKTSKSQ